ncbi:MAG: co-chaperone DjlA [Pseudomonas sp.]
MLWPITLGGAVLGGLVGELPGLLLGGLLGHALDRHWGLRRWSDVPQRWRAANEKAFSYERILFMCLGRLAKAEGRVLPAHLQLARDLMQQYRLDEAARLQAIQWFNEGKTPNRRLTPMVRKLLKRQPERTAELLDCCWRMALADGVLGANERELLDEWAGHAGLGRAEQQRMHQRHRRDTDDRHTPPREPVVSRNKLAEAASLLEVELDASPEQIKRAYRRQLSRHHPDKLIARGASEKAQDGAGERIHQIQEAYERIKRYRGFR